MQFTVQIRKENYKKSTFLVSKNCIINFLKVKICIAIVDQNKAYSVTNWNIPHLFGKKVALGIMELVKSL